MAKTIIKTKWHLTGEQMSQLIAECKDTKLTWYMQELTTKQFVPYDTILGIARVPGTSNLDLTFEEGLFQCGMEVKCAVGDYKVVDENGRHCQQTAFFYIDGNGQAIPCKFRELPSQNDGVIPEPAPEAESADDGNNPFLTWAKEHPPQNEKVSPSNVMPFNFEKIDYVFCEKGQADAYPHSTADSCVYFDDEKGTPQNDPSACCGLCKFGKQLIYIKDWN